jgi:uncharacterized protein YbaP (TraB family)
MHITRTRPAGSEAPAIGVFDATGTLVVELDPEQADATAADLTALAETIRREGW